MKKYILLAFAFMMSCFVSFVHPQRVSAHLIEMDNNVHGEIHFEPGDEFPVSGQLTTYYFHFENIANKTKMKSCDCTFSVWQNDQQLYTAPLLPYAGVDKAFNLMAKYTLPATGKYDFKVAGHSTDPKNFPPFEIVWDVESKEAVASPTPAPVLESAIPSMKPEEASFQKSSRNWKFYLLVSVLGASLVISVASLTLILRKNR